MWGTAARIDTLFLQIHSQQNPSAKPAVSSLAMHSQVQKADMPEAKKLSEVAERTQEYWKAKYYNDAQKEKAEKDAQKAIKKGSKPAPQKTKEVPKKSKLGLTAAEMKVRDNKMKAAAEGVSKMKENLELQQGEENARKIWCV